MVGVGYGKGASLPEEHVRWLTPDEIDAKQQRGLRLRFFDARDTGEFAAGTLPGAESLPQTQLMFMKKHAQPLIDDIIAGAGGADDLVLFANTAGVGNGMTSGRDVYVMAYLLELGVPLERMARLTGGLNAWKASGRPTPKPASPVTAGVSGLADLLEASDLGRLVEPLASLTLTQLQSTLADDGRPAVLAALKDCGLLLTDRQAVAKAVARYVRERSS